MKESTAYCLLCLSISYGAIAMQSLFTRKIFLAALTLLAVLPISPIIACILYGVFS